MSDLDKHTDNSLQIEKQKTLRLLMILGSGLIVAGVALFILFQSTSGGGSGKVDIDLTSGKVSLSLEKPIVDQVKLNTSSASSGGNTVQFTEGKIQSADTIREIESIAARTSPTSFSGQNYINNEAGFLFSVLNPINWQVQYDSNGLYNPAMSLLRVYNAEGSHLNVNFSNTSGGLNIQQFVDMNIQASFQSGILMQMPEITYDYASQTAFAIVTNPMTQGQSYMKFIIDQKGDRAVVASANYNNMLSSPGAIQELTNMIATLTLIDR